MSAWGIKSRDLEGIAPIIASALGIDFAAHESSFHGGDYYRALTAAGEVILQSNCDADPVSEEPFEDNWPIDELILCFDGLNEEAWRPYIQALMNLTELHPVNLRGE